MAKKDLEELFEIVRPGDMVDIRAERDDEERRPLRRNGGDDSRGSNSPSADGTGAAATR